jgi:hypothetical protein
MEVFMSLTDEELLTYVDLTERIAATTHGGGAGEHLRRATA